jgi:uncharacterized protein YhfF
VARKADAQVMESPEEFWQRCCEALAPEAWPRGDPERQIGNPAAMVHQILELIIAGDKRGTVSLPDKLERDATLPVPGDYMLLTRFAASAACLVQAEACKTLPFDQIGAAGLQLEGPAAWASEVWRAFHERDWTSMLAAWGQPFKLTQPVLARRCRLLQVACA